eukprot:CAMPEP_0117770976 /NCGR_PEP_ID=MMETSP0947-20121206/24167_1 /TAXON_ID=44440 /ORGANISM="Chattonella subsalsa, Strain CCMP2191" /LENGTH=141 /DNA_ID=CAMNT_0005596203 /DNA_START=184 /DNA_END=609 /DNA_ORIENTATION=+
MMVGEFEASDFDYSPFPWATTCIFVVYMFTMAILLLNFIIAVLTDTYDTVKITAKAQALWEKAKIILELHDVISLKTSELIDEEMTWVHVLMPQGWKSKVSTDTQILLDSLTDRLDQMEKHHGHAYQEIMKKLNTIESKEL